MIRTRLLRRSRPSGPKGLRGKNGARPMPAKPAPATDQQRFRRMWRGRRPLGLVSPAFLRPDPDPAVAVHRRTLAQARPGIPRPAWWSLQSWLWLRWSTYYGWTSSRAAVDKWGEEAAFDWGVPIAEQRRRVRRLALAHGVPAGDAYSFGLVADPSRMWEYLYTCETGWNSAVAGGPKARRQGETISDKQRTNAILRRAGVPVVPTLAVLSPAPQPDGAPGANAGEEQSWREQPWQDWLSRWSVLHVKQVNGSKGRGAFEMRKGSGPDPFTVVPYPQDTPVDDPTDFVAQRLAVAEYLVQPRLVSHSLFADSAKPGDVVTVRIVTRRLPGTGVETFSVALEVPLDWDAEVNRRRYLAMSVGPQGSIADFPTPSWLLPHSDTSETAANLLRGSRLPGFHDMEAAAHRGHGCFPDMFAIAWDVAITDNGPIFLEGNTGFGLLAPQMLSGGLLAGGVSASRTSSGAKMLAGA